MGLFRRSDADRANRSSRVIISKAVTISKAMAISNAVAISKAVTISKAPMAIGSSTRRIGDSQRLRNRRTLRIDVQCVNGGTRTHVEAIMQQFAEHHVGAGLR